MLCLPRDVSAAAWILLGVLAVPPLEPAVVEAPPTTTATTARRPSAAVLGLTSVGFATGVLLWGTSAWWGDDDLDSFRIYKEAGFFGKDTYAGGADKLGHAYSAYVSTSLVAYTYESLGLDRTRATWWAGVFTFVLFNGFELIDGFDSRFGFEPGDVLMNTLGVSLGVLMRLSPTADRLFAFRLGYWPTQDFLAHDRTVTKFINDYSGMTFHLDLRLKGVLELAGREPGLWRYGLVGFAFRTENYSPIRRDDARRQLLGLHLGLSLPEILRAWSEGDPAVETLASVGDYLAVPFLGVTVFHETWRDAWSVELGLGARFELQ